MSSSFILAPRAKADLKNIGRYTQEKWGVEQRNLYLLGIEKCFHWLARNPRLGVKRDEIKEGYFSFVHQQHTIFYTINSDGNVNIIGIVGPGQNLDLYFH